MNDIELNEYGSVSFLVGLTDSGLSWLQENLSAEPWQWYGMAIACEPRMAHDLLEMAVDDGLEVAA